MLLGIFGNMVAGNGIKATRQEQRVMRAGDGVIQTGKGARTNQGQEIIRAGQNF